MTLSARLFGILALSSALALGACADGPNVTDLDPTTNANPCDGHELTSYQGATITCAVGGIDYTWPATIDRIGARVSAERGGVEVHARISEAANPVQLRPGAFVALTVPDRNWPKTFRLPETAIRSSDHVYVVVDGELRRRDVRLIAWDGEDAIVDGDLADGDTVLVTRLIQSSRLSLRLTGS